MRIQDPYAWMRSMQAKAYHSGLHERLSFEDLLTTEWAGFSEDGVIRDTIFAKYLASALLARQVRHRPPSRNASMASCVTDHSVDASGAEDCLHEGVHYRCTLAPGFRLSFGNEPSPAPGLSYT
jgi:hypothetical protein